MIDLPKEVWVWEDGTEWPLLCQDVALGLRPPAYDNPVVYVPKNNDQFNAGIAAAKREVMDILGKQSGFDRRIQLRLDVVKKE